MNNTDQKKSSRFIGEAALLVMTIIWGATFVIVKEAINDISSMLFVTTRFGIAGLILLAVLYFKKQKTMLDEVRAGLFLGLLLFLGFFTKTIGLKYTSATKSGFLTGTLVVMVPLFQTIIEKKFPSKGAQLGTVLVFFGIIFLSSSANSLQYFFSEIGTNFGIGEQLTLACAVFFALHVVYIDIYTAKFNFWILLTTQIITVSILSLLTSFLLAGLSIEPIRINFSSYLIFGIIYTSIFATLITMGLQTRFQKVVSPTKAGIIYSFEPIFAALFAFFLLSEKITNFSLLGCGLIFLGLLSAEIMDYFFERKNGS